MFILLLVFGTWLFIELRKYDIKEITMVGTKT